MKLCIYFGTEMPDLTWSEDLGPSDVVLEPYHPLVQGGGFAEAFPDARRFVYVNPTTIDPWVLDQLADPPPMIGRDERWNLPRLDLDHPEGFAWAVRSACAALKGDRGRIHGAFVDDLDSMLPDREELAIEFFVQVALHLETEPAWFINRGFSLWPRIEHLEAVLLEDISPDLAARAPTAMVRWIHEQVLPAVRAVRRRGVRVHSMDYADQQESLGVAPDENLRAEVAGLVDSVTSGADRQLHDWRASS
ncbi:MAG: hypothetical protein JWR27_1010 [Aeromicrobium sp.]|jgi:hypothetical protein|nr:hypothetical protein [Aeromicrobium sp.]